MNILKISLSYIFNKKGSSKIHSFIAIIGISIGICAFLVVSHFMAGFQFKIYNDVNLGYDLSISNYKDSEINNIIDTINNDNILNYSVIQKVKNANFSINSEKNEKIIKQKIDINIIDNKYTNNDYEGLFFDKSVFEYYTKLEILKDKFFLLSLDSKEESEQDLLQLKETTIKDIVYPRNEAYITKKQFNESFYLPYSFENKIFIQLKNFKQSREIKLLLEKKFPEYKIESWEEGYSDLIDNIKIESFIILLVLFFILLLSSFNIVSTLNIIIAEKKSDLFILKTLGYSDLSVISIFVFLGFIIGFFGIILGCFLGYFISINLYNIINFIELIFNIDTIGFLIKDISFNVNKNDYIKIIKITTIIIIIASIIPSLKILKNKPADGLKNE